MYHLFIYLLILFLIKLLIIPVREGGPMVGSVKFPSRYTGTTNVTHKPISISEKNNVKGLVKTEITEKKDQRVSKNRRGEHWHEAREDVDVKKDVDVVHRYPEVWNNDSLKNCHSKMVIIHKNNHKLKILRKKISKLVEYRKQIVRAIEYMLHNIGISEKKLHNSAMLASGAASGALPTALPVGGVAPPSAPPLHLMGKEAASLLSSNPMGLRVK